MANRDGGGKKDAATNSRTYLIVKGDRLLFLEHWMNVLAKEDGKVACPLFLSPGAFVEMPGSF